MLQSLAAKKYGQARMRDEAGKLGLAMPTEAVPQLINAHKGDVAEAAAPRRSRRDGRGRIIGRSLRRRSGVW